MIAPCFALSRPARVVEHLYDDCSTTPDTRPGYAYVPLLQTLQEFPLARAGELKRPHLPSFGFAMSPAEVQRGAVYEFVLNHAVDIGRCSAPSSVR